MAEVIGGSVGETVDRAGWTPSSVCWATKVTTEARGSAVVANGACHAGAARGRGTAHGGHAGDRQ